jgi:hypothetical protein
MADIIQIRRDLSTNWTASNPVLADGELGFEKNTKKGKLGDGITAWNSLPYSFTGESSNVAEQITAAASKTTPVDADQFGITDSAAGNILKKLSWANIKATLLTYFNAIYEPVFAKGTLVQGSNVTLTGTLTNRLVGTGNVTIAATGGSLGLALPVNRYIYSQGAFNFFSRTWNREGESVFVPFTHMIYANTDMKVDRIGFNITGTDNNANTFIRLGIFEQNTATGEMIRIVDAGQVGTIGNGIKEVTVNQTLTKGKMYYILFARQGFDFVNVAVTTGDTVGNALFYSTATAQNNVNAYGTAVAGITGAFASSYTATPQWNFLPLILLRLQNV